MLEILALLAAFAAGFGVGRIKNKAKLDAVATLVAHLEATALKDVNAVVAAFKARI